jgi:hypothetical protein
MAFGVHVCMRAYEYEYDFRKEHYDGDAAAAVSLGFNDEWIATTWSE